jgi:ABC-type nitrate/sulfonate/bicarbonate transport system substrate-binding protein
MTTVHLGFKAFDLHELACHFIARQAGLYAARGLDVHLLETTFLADEQLPARTFQAACTAALIAWLRGAPVRVVFVACDRPMFWLIGRAGATLSEVAHGGRIASYPPGAAPGDLLRLVLGEAGQGGEPVLLPARDDNARLGLLLSGEVNAAVISSAVPVQRLTRRGLTILNFFGDALRLPTTGLAVHADLLDREPGLVRAMCACYRESLRLLREDTSLTAAAFQAALGLGDDEAARAIALVRECYTIDGRADPASQAAAIDAVRRALGGGAPPGAGLYDFSMLAHNGGKAWQHDR